MTYSGSCLCLYSVFWRLSFGLVDMKNKNAQNFPEFLKFLQQYQALNQNVTSDLPPLPRHRIVPGWSVDVATMMESHRQNLQAFATVQQMTMDGLHVLTRSAGQMMADLMEAHTHYAQSISTPDLTGEKMGDRALILQKMFDRASDHFYEISDIAHRSGRETGHVVRARVSASLGDLKTAADRARARRAR